METKTTLRLPQSLLREARVKAVRQGLSLSEVIRRLLRLWLSGQVEAESAASRQRQAMVQLAREAFGMWNDRDPNDYMTRSRARLALRDQEVEDARLGI